MVKPSYEQLVEALVQRDEVIAELRAGLIAACEEIAVLKRRLDQDQGSGVVVAIGTV